MTIKQVTRKRGRPPKHAVSAAKAKGKIVFRRASNRRLYDRSGYTTTSELLRHPRRRVLVIDATTGRDITDYALAAARHQWESIRLRVWKRELGL